MFLFGCGTSTRLASLGMKKEEDSTISEKLPRSVVAELGIVVLGAVDVPIYRTLISPHIACILNEGRVKVVIVSNSLPHRKILKTE